MSKKDINGLVLAGGLSTRMGADKALLQYHDKPQYLYAYELLQNVCKKVFISTNKNQKFSVASISDEKEFETIGPMAGLLSAFKKERTAWFIIAIDYPFFGDIEIESLILARDESKKATICFNSETGYYEPFLGIYEPSFFENSEEMFKEQNYGLQRILRKDAKHICAVKNIRVEALKSIDTIDVYNKIKNR